MAFPVFFDTCTLFGQTLCDVLLSMAEEGIFVPYWSKEVLDAVTRNVVKRGRAEPKAIARRVELMQESFPDAMVTDFESLIPVMTNHPGDRHVLAACVASPALTIITSNVKDFPESSTRPYGFEVVDPDDFLLDQLSLHPIQSMRAIQTMLLRNRRPPTDVAALASRLAADVPRFAAALQRLSESPLG